MTRTSPSANDISDTALPRISHGSGSHLWDSTGKRYVDGSGGPAVYSLGHGDARVNRAVADQMARVAHGYRYVFTADPLEAMTEIVLAACGPEYGGIVFVTGGSEAVESALKIALQYHYDRGEPGRTRFIARARSWHGNTLMATALSGFADRQRAFAGALPAIGRVSAANAFRPPAGVAPEDLTAHLAAELDAEIRRLGPETVAAFVWEPVVGAAGGALPAPPGYGAAMAQVCRRHGVLMIADEVMCGAGRTGVWRASAADGVVPDILTVAKSVSGGYLPLGAAVFTGRVAEVLRAGHGGPLTGHTYTGHTACLAAGVAVQRIIAEEDLVARVATRGPAFRADLAARLAHLPQVADIRGRGFFLGLEIVQDPATRAPFDATLGVNSRIRRAALDRGLICYPSGGNVDGRNGDTVILAPAYNATEADLEEIADKTAATLDAVLGTLPGRP